MLHRDRFHGSRGQRDARNGNRILIDKLEDTERGVDAQQDDSLYAGQLFPFQGGQRHFNIVFGFVCSFFIQRCKSGKYLVFAVEAQSDALVGNFSRKGFIYCGSHLARNKTVVDEPVEHELFPAQRAFDGIRRTGHIGRPDGFMRVLCVFAALEFVFILGQIFLPVFFGNKMRILRKIRHLISIFYANTCFICIFCLLLLRNFYINPYLTEKY